MNLTSINENNLSLSDRAANQIILYIRENNLTEGDRLPVETEFMERLNVSRSTVREAIRTLSSKNIVVVKRGCGTFVYNSVADDPLGLNLKQNRKKMIRDLLELRMMLEPPIAAICAERATKEEINELWQLHKNIEHQIRNGQQYTEFDVRLHCNIAKHTHNDIIMTLIPEITKGVSLFVESTGEALLQKTIDTHSKIVRAIQNRDKQASYDAMYQHLKDNQDYLNSTIFNNDKDEKYDYIYNFQKYNNQP